MGAWVEAEEKGEESRHRPGLGISMFSFVVLCFFFFLSLSRSHNTYAPPQIGDPPLCTVKKKASRRKHRKVHKVRLVLAAALNSHFHQPQFLSAGSMKASESKSRMQVITQEG